MTRSRPKIGFEHVELFFKLVSRAFLVKIIDGVQNAVTQPIQVGGVSYQGNSYLGAFNLQLPDARAVSEVHGLTGMLDDVAIYEGILNAEQIDALHAGQLSPEQIRH